MNQDYKTPVDIPDGDEPLNACGKTHRGLKRSDNQDQFLIARLSKSIWIDDTSLEIETRRQYGRTFGEVLLVADGMGGHAGGRRASEVAIVHLISKLLSAVHTHFHGKLEEDLLIKDLQAMLQDTHARILTEAARNAEIRGMGTTVTMAYIVWPTMYVVHAGDSRCYLIGDDGTKQITTDHTLARQMVESGGLKPEEEATSRWSNVLWNVLGGSNDGDIIAEVHKVDLQARDTVVLCSDGLHRYLDQGRLSKLLDAHPETREACESLIQLALDSGGEDNVTAIVYRSPGESGERATWIEDFDGQISSTMIDSEPTEDDFHLPETDPELNLRETDPEGLL
ncbi:MAG: protein phosphatase 2C domain-containing protein [Planctomycetota bacterium]